jgi:hypothetical protein
MKRDGGTRKTISMNQNVTQKNNMYFKGTRKTIGMAQKVTQKTICIIKGQEKQ